MPLVTREKVDVPDGVEVKVSGQAIEVSGKRGKVTRSFDFKGLKIILEGRTVTAEMDSVARKGKAAIGTFKAHLLNMFKGVTEGYAYKLRVVYSHFPITVKAETKRFLVTNFLGERSSRVADIVGDTTVEVKGDEVVVKGIDKDQVGQTAINIEKSTSVKHRDLRTFQDGIYIFEKL